MPSRDQWQSTWVGLGVSVTPAILQDFESLLARYAEPHRRYHTARHLDECFEKLAALRGLADHPAEGEVALWFHEGIYERRSLANEAKSADLAVSKASAAGVPVDCAERIRRLIMATRHAAIPSGIDEEVLVDVD